MRPTRRLDGEALKAPHFTADEQRGNVASFPSRPTVSVMNVDSAHLLFAALVGFFGIVTPFIIRGAADFLRITDVTPWRCVKAGLGGLAGLVLAMKVGSDTNSLLLGVCLMAAIWAASIHFFLKTTLLRALGVWFITHGCVLLIAFGVNQLVDVETRLAQLFAHG